MCHCCQRTGAVGAKGTLGWKRDAVADTRQPGNRTGNEGPKGGDERDGISNASKKIRRTWRVGAREVAIGDGPGGIDGFDSVHSAWPAQLPHDPYEDNGSDHPTDDTPSSGNGVFEFLNNLSQKPLCLPNARPTLAQHAGASVDILDPDRQFPWIGRASRRAGHN